MPPAQPSDVPSTLPPLQPGVEPSTVDTRDIHCLSPPPTNAESAAALAIWCKIDSDYLYTYVFGQIVLNGDRVGPPRDYMDYCEDAR